MKIENINWNNFFSKNTFNFDKKIALSIWHILFDWNFEKKNEKILEYKILISKTLIKKYIIWFYLYMLHALACSNIYMPWHDCLSIISKHITTENIQNVLRITNKSIKNLSYSIINYNYNFLTSTKYPRFLYEEEKHKKQ